MQARRNSQGRDNGSLPRRCRAQEAPPFSDCWPVRCLAKALYISMGFHAIWTRRRLLNVCVCACWGRVPGFEVSSKSEYMGSRQIRVPGVPGRFRDLLPGAGGESTFCVRVEARILQSPPQTSDTPPSDPIPLNPVQTSLIQACQSLIQACQVAPMCATACIPGP